MYTTEKMKLLCDRGLVFTVLTFRVAFIVFKGFHLPTINAYWLIATWQCSTTVQLVHSNLDFEQKLYLSVHLPHPCRSSSGDPHENDIPSRVDVSALLPFC